GGEGGSRKGWATAATTIGFFMPRPSLRSFPLDRLNDSPDNDAGNIAPGGCMARISRRAFFRIAAADAAVAGLVASRVVRLHAHPPRIPIGSQTYPHRAMIKEGNFAELAKILADIGVQRVEMCSPLGYADFAALADGKQVRKILSDHGLKSESGHFSMRELRERQSESI